MGGVLWNTVLFWPQDSYCTYGHREAFLTCTTLHKPVKTPTWIYKFLWGPSPSWGTTNTQWQRGWRWIISLWKYGHLSITNALVIASWTYEATLTGLSELWNKEGHKAKREVFWGVYGMCVESNNLVSPWERKANSQEALKSDTIETTIELNPVILYINLNYLSHFFQ